MSRLEIRIKCTCNEPNNSEIKTSGAIPLCEVTALNHVIFDHSVELAAFISFPFWQLSKFPEILDRLRNSFAKQTNFYSARINIADLDVEPYLKFVLFVN